MLGHTWIHELLVDSDLGGTSLTGSRAGSAALPSCAGGATLLLCVVKKTEPPEKKMKEEGESATRMGHQKGQREGRKGKHYLALEQCLVPKVASYGQHSSHQQESKQAVKSTQARERRDNSRHSQSVDRAKDRRSGRRE